MQTQYRMHPEIVSFPNRQFYGGKLGTDLSVSERPSIFRPRPTSIKGKSAADFWWLLGFVFLNTVGVVDKIGTSPRNRAEAEMVIKIITFLRSPVCNLSGTERVGVIAFYSEQVKLIEELLEQSHLRNEFTKVISVDSFQGSECEVCILSFVRGSKDISVGFVKDHQRLNVALTRGKHLLVGVGCASTLEIAQDVNDSNLMSLSNSLAAMVADSRNRDRYFEAAEAEEAMKNAEEQYKSMSIDSDDQKAFC